MSQTTGQIIRKDWRTLVLPKEHGSWSLAFEPVCLGLLVAPSWAGLGLLLAAVAGFLTRQPLKLAVRARSTDERRWPALVLAAIGGSATVMGLLGAAALSGPVALWPLLLAVPFGAAFLWFDWQQQMREAEAELAGSIAFALLPAAFATLCGWSIGPALAVAAVMLMRSVPAVLTVRTYLRRRKGVGGAVYPPLVASLGFLAVAIWLGSQHLLPVWVPWLGGILALRTMWMVSVWAPDWPAKRVGMLEAVLGLGYLAGVFWAYRMVP